MRMLTRSFLVLGLGWPILMAGCGKPTQGRTRPAGIPPSSDPAALPPIVAKPGATPPSMPAVAANDEAEMVPDAPDPKATIVGKITLSDANKKRIAPSDVVFIIARRAGGPPGPMSMLAVQKHPVGDFPMAFTLSARDAMIPNTPFTGPVNISVRLDKDGDPVTRQKGDILGHADAVAVGTQNVVISLDFVQQQDEALAGPPKMGGPMGGGLPPGHP